MLSVLKLLEKNGEIRWVEDHKTAIFSKTGKFVGLEGVVFDITDRKQAEIDLREAHEEMEQRVKERTIELSVANTQLNVEIEGRKQIEASLRASENHLRSLMESAGDFAIYRLKLDVSHPYNAQVIVVSPSIKEIAELMHLSIKTIESHRKSIRRKLNLTNTKTNLRTYLLSRP